MRRGIWLMAAVLCLGCKTTSDDSALDFAALPQDQQLQPYLDDKLLLIHHVHDAIRYHVHIGNFRRGFQGAIEELSQPQEPCISPALVDQELRRALKLWLDQLRQAADAGRLELLEPVEPLLEAVPLEQAQLLVRVNCSKHKFTAHVAAIPGQQQVELMLQVDPQADLLPKVPSKLRSFFKSSWLGTPEAGFPRSDLTHEVAHTFGLHDTYYSGFYGRPDGHSKWISHPYFGSIQGRQPIGVMWNPIVFARPADHEQDGMAWLYRYYVRKDLAQPTDCLPGYKYDEPSRGCIYNQAEPPAHIFENRCLEAFGTVNGKQCVCGSGAAMKKIRPLAGETCGQVNHQIDPVDLYCRYYVPDWQPYPNDPNDADGKYELRKVESIRLKTEQHRVRLEYRLAWHWDYEQEFFIPWGIYSAFNNVLQSKGSSQTHLLAHFLSAAATAQAPKARRPQACYHQDD